MIAMWCILPYAKACFEIARERSNPKLISQCIWEGCNSESPSWLKLGVHLHHPSKPSNAQFNPSMYWRSVLWKRRDIQICLCHCLCFDSFSKAVNSMILFLLVLISWSSNPSSRPAGLGRSLSATLFPFYSICFLSRLRRCHLKSSMCFCG